MDYSGKCSMCISENVYFTDVWSVLCRPVSSLVYSVQVFYFLVELSSGYSICNCEFGIKVSKYCRNIHFSLEFCQVFLLQVFKPSCSVHCCYIVLVDWCFYQSIMFCLSHNNLCLKVYFVSYFYSQALFLWITFLLFMFFRFKLFLFCRINFKSFHFPLHFYI